MTDPVTLALCRLGALVADLVEDQQHVERRQLAADDRRVGRVLVPLAFALASGRPFTVHGLVERAYSDNGQSPTSQALVEAVAEYGSLRQVGKLFARLAGVVLGGCRLVRVGKRGDDVLYIVESVSDD
jgi:hypothetical protein